jgi:hypothetical protein
MRRIGIVVFCAALTGCVESRFELAPDSRLPSWFVVPDGLTRADVSASLTYYSAGPAKFNLLDRNGHVLATFESQTCWHPETLRKKNIHGGYNPDSYPHYVYFLKDGMVEVVEHRGEPKFRVSDNVELKQAALRVGKCLRSTDSAP